MSISMVSVKKARKTDYAKHDRISKLPEPIISHILSCLPTKDAVRTSVLSQYWEYKWTSIPDIELDVGTRNDNKSCEATFANFVDRTLLLSQNLQSLRLSCYGEYYLSRMKAWILSSLSRGVNCLNVRYTCKGIKFPCDLFNCYSLRKLVLDVRCTFKVVAGIGFLYLTTLDLVEVEFLNMNNNSDVVKFNSPVLETLSLIRCKWLNTKFVEIDAPRMTVFKCWSSYYATGIEYYSIKISASNLVDFEVGGPLSGNIVISGKTEVIYAALMNLADDSLPKKDGLAFRKLLEGFPSIEDLTLSGVVAKAIAQSNVKLSLPKFYKMKKLVAIEYLCNTRALFELLIAMPYLKFLVIDSRYLEDHDYDADGYIPSCIVSHLKEITFTWYDGELPEQRLIQFFLKNALHLEKLHVCVYDERDCDNFAEEISKYPRASTSVVITVTAEEYVTRI